VRASRSRVKHELAVIAHDPHVAIINGPGRPPPIIVRGERAELQLPLENKTQDQTYQRHQTRPKRCSPELPPPTPVGGLRNGHRMALEFFSGTNFGCALHFCTVFLAKLLQNAWPQPFARIDQPAAANMTNMLVQIATKARGSSIARPKRSGWRSALARQAACRGKPERPTGQ